MIVYGICADGKYRVRRESGPFIGNYVFPDKPAAHAAARRLAGPWGRVVYTVFGVPETDIDEAELPEEDDDTWDDLLVAEDDEE